MPLINNNPYIHNDHNKAVIFSLKFVITCLIGAVIFGVLELISPTNTNPYIIGALLGSAVCEGCHFILRVKAERNRKTKRGLR